MDLQEILENNSTCTEKHQFDFRGGPNIGVFYSSSQVLEIFLLALFVLFMSFCSH